MNNTEGMKMSKFINFDVNNGLSISDEPDSRLREIGNLAEAVTIGDVNVSCPLEGAKEALEDGCYWGGSSVSMEALDEIYEFLENQH